VWISGGGPGRAAAPSAGAIPTSRVPGACVPVVGWLVVRQAEQDEDLGSSRGAMAAGLSCLAVVAATQRGPGSDLPHRSMEKGAHRRPHLREAHRASRPRPIIGRRPPSTSILVVAMDYERDVGLVSFKLDRFGPCDVL
jgi:hypothetical protein